MLLVPISLNEVIARDRSVGNYGISRDAATIKDQSRCQTTSRSKDDDWFASASILSRTLATTADIDDPVMIEGGRRTRILLFSIEED